MVKCDYSMLLWACPCARRRTSGKRLVVAVLLEQGRWPNDYLAPWWGNLVRVCPPSPLLDYLAPCWGNLVRHGHGCPALPCPALPAAPRGRTFYGPISISIPSVIVRHK